MSPSLSTSARRISAAAQSSSTSPHPKPSWRYGAGRACEVTLLDVSYRDRATFPYAPQPCSTSHALNSSLSATHYSSPANASASVPLPRSTQPEPARIHSQYLGAGAPEPCGLDTPILHLTRIERSMSADACSGTTVSTLATLAARASFRCRRILLHLLQFGIIPLLFPFAQTLRSTIIPSSSLRCAIIDSVAFGRSMKLAKS